MCCSARALPSICTWMCNLSNTPPTPLPHLSLLQTVQRWFRVWGEDADSINAEKKHRHFLTIETVSHLVSLDMERDVCRDVCFTHLFLFPPLVSDSVTLTSFGSPSVSFCLFYLLCPSQALPVLWGAHYSCLFLKCFSSYLEFFSHPSHYPLVFCSHFIFHLNTFSLSLSPTHTPLVLSSMEVVAHLLLLLPTTESIISVIISF